MRGRFGAGLQCCVCGCAPASYGGQRGRFHCRASLHGGPRLGDRGQWRARSWRQSHQSHSGSRCACRVGRSRAWQRCRRRARRSCLRCRMQPTRFARRLTCHRSRGMALLREWPWSWVFRRRVDVASGWGVDARGLMPAQPLRLGWCWRAGVGRGSGLIESLSNKHPKHKN